MIRINYFGEGILRKKVVKEPVEEALAFCKTKFGSHIQSCLIV